MRIPSSKLPSISSSWPLPTTETGHKAYVARLQKMSMGQLQTELKKQQERLYIAQHGVRYDPVMEKDAQAKIALVQKEIASRVKPVKDPYAQYAKDVKKMSDAELKQEIATQQQRIWMAQHGIRYVPEMEKDAMAKLKICSAEAAARGIAVPKPGPFGMIG